MWGSKIFSLNDSLVSVIEVALSVPLYQYLETKMFKYEEVVTLLLMFILYSLYYCQNFTNTTI